MHGEFKKRKYADLECGCRAHGIPLTFQRRAVLEELATRKDHPTADQLYDALRERMPGFSRTTVYRVLDTLVKLGVVARVASSLPMGRFDANTERHHHVFCSVCNKIVDLHSETLNRLDAQALLPEGFQLLGYSVCFTGVCAGCLKKVA